MRSIHLEKENIFAFFVLCSSHWSSENTTCLFFFSHLPTGLFCVIYWEGIGNAQATQTAQTKPHTHTRREYIQPEYFACACYYFANELTVFSSVWLMCFKNISMECVHSACAFALSLCSAFISSISIKMNFVKNHCNERLSGSFVNGWGALYENTPNKQINTHAYHSIFISSPWNNSLNSIKYDEPSAALTNFSYSKWSIIQLLYITPQGHGNYSVPKSFGLAAVSLFWNEQFHSGNLALVSRNYVHSNQEWEWARWKLKLCRPWKCPQGSRRLSTKSPLLIDCKRWSEEIMRDVIWINKYLNISISLN